MEGSVRNFQIRERKSIRHVGCYSCFSVVPTAKVRKRIWNKIGRLSMPDEGVQTLTGWLDPNRVFRKTSRLVARGMAWRAQR